MNNIEYLIAWAVAVFCVVGIGVVIGIWLNWREIRSITDHSDDYHSEDNTR